MMNQKTIVCVFAHPDDEAFGPGGTIAKLARRHNVFVISATTGQEGKDRGKRRGRNLAKIRAAELKSSARILGVKKVFILNFRDGTLSNNLYHAIARKISAITQKLRPNLFITYEPGGVSGHIDHIAVSMVTSFVFQRFSSARYILQYCIPYRRSRMLRNYFIHVPRGYDARDTDLKVDISDAWDTKVNAMHAHQSQVHDIERILRMVKRFPKEENFLVRVRDQRSKRPSAADIRRIRKFL